LQLSTNLSANNQVSDALLTAYLSIQLDEAAASPAMWQRLGEAYQDSLAARLIPFDRTVQEIIWSPQRKHLISHLSDGSFSIFSFPDPQNPQSARSQKQPLIQHASYTLQFSYERTESDVFDLRHGDNYFRYGYVGDFDIEWVPR
jgi:hypothetical protein